MRFGAAMLAIACASVGTSSGHHVTVDLPRPRDPLPLDQYKARRARMRSTISGDELVDLRRKNARRKRRR